MSNHTSLSLLEKLGTYGDKARQLLSQRRYRIILQLLFMVLILGALFIILKDQVQSIQAAQIRKLLNEVSWWDRFVFIFWGLLSFSFCGLYDPLLGRYFRLPLGFRRLWEIGWIAQSFNNFIGFGGLTGGGLRLRLYKDAGIDDDKAFHISTGIWISTLLGLFVLALPAGIGLYQLGFSRYLILCVLFFLCVPLYLWIDLLPIGLLRSQHSPLSHLNRSIRLGTIGISALEWLAAALFFAYALRFFDPSIPWTVGILVYTIAMMIGMMSMIPGGLGSFDGAVLAILTGLGFNVSGIVLALLVERLFYTLLPWFISLFRLAKLMIWHHVDDNHHYRLVGLYAQSLALGVFVCGLLLLLSVAMPGVLERMDFLYQFIPYMVSLFSQMITMAAAILLMILSRGLYLQVRRAQQASVVSLLVAAFFCLFKGLDFEEALLLTIFAVLLIYSRAAFNKPSKPITRKAILRLTAMIALLLALYLPIFYGLGTFFDSHPPRGPWLNYLMPAAVFLFFGLIVIITFITLITRRSYLTFYPPSAQDHEQFYQLMETYGGGPFAHLFYMGDKMLFWNHSHTVALMYRPFRNHIFVLGDPLGNSDDYESAIGELVAWANGLGMLVSFYEISPNYLSAYIEEGFRFLKLGESARIDLATFSTGGRKNKGLRYSAGLMKKGGLTLELSMPPHASPKIQRWQTISEEWLNGRDELSYSLGAFDEAYLQKSPVYELIDAEGVCQAFVSFMTHQEEGVLSIDLMRYGKDAPPAVMDMLFLAIIDRAKEAGYHYFDLGISPLANVGQALYSDAREKLMRTAYEFGNRIYSFAGLHSFKNKFHPRWEPVYLAYKENRYLADILLSLVYMIHRTEQEPVHPFSQINHWDVFADPSKKVSMPLK